ncbi:hypothetical protein GQ43DRAFT_439670 [Delitschia confertaspora ATCC 74209]|uniref:Uncharacterized protein n=1 Tax=Delitschia confertaspora ATCC 74209 TaxID=1513339 RepID=A0A9P4MTW8_9PLEO|nr:hypothetical protein GQ43DRAFT_439670 [Delitschia confertaspora ATCC 74209]
MCNTFFFLCCFLIFVYSLVFSGILFEIYSLSSSPSGVFLIYFLLSVLLLDNDIASVGRS